MRDNGWPMYFQIKAILLPSKISCAVQFMSSFSNHYWLFQENDWEKVSQNKSYICCVCVLIWSTQEFKREFWFGLLWLCTVNMICMYVCISVCVWVWVCVHACMCTHTQIHTPDTHDFQKPGYHHSICVFKCTSQSAYDMVWTHSAVTELFGDDAVIRM